MRLHEVMRTLIVIVALGVVLLFILPFVADATGGEPFLSGGVLLFGWIAFLKRASVEVAFDRVAVISGGICLILIAIGLHWVCSWLYRTMSPEPTTRRWPFRWTFMISTGLVIMFAAGICMVALAHQGLWLARSPRPLHHDNRLEFRCAANMRVIGQSILAYANAHNGHLPDTLEQICFDGGLTPDRFICPESADRPAEGATVEQWAPQLSVPGHLSYIYVGKGISAPNSSGDSRPILCEHAGNHERSLVNILFADGHVEACLPAEWQSFSELSIAATKPTEGQPPSAGRYAPAAVANPQ